MPFEKLRVRPLPAIQAEAQEYEHPEWGARHIHLATDDKELVFLVAFPTLPQASDGRAHILEHLALSGSARYPVRDPFFAMLRRSTAHFMNAMTYPDRTVYPFASTDKTDFFNLLDVYLDAAFFPRLDYLDFLQEGWRLGFEDERLVYQGVVFNEMKGAFADPYRALEAGLGAALFEGTTYAVESGGDPLHIPELTHAALRDFHAAHYHPSQAVFMSAGRIEASEIQSVLEERVLTGSAERRGHMLPQLASGWNAPRAVDIKVPTSEYGVQIAWRRGESADPVAYYEMQLLESGLLGNAAAPLARALESAGYGRPSVYNGTDTSARELVFHVGMEGLSRSQIEKARKRIWNALEQAAEKGAPKEMLSASLRDLRFALRDMKGGETPHALRRLLRALPQALYGGDVMNGFDSESVLSEMQQRIEDPAYFKSLVRSLLDEPTRLDATIIPDANFFAEREQAEQQKLDALQARLDQAESTRIRAESQALQERQRREGDNSILPRIHPADLDPEPRPAPALPPARDGVLAVPLATNGITHVRILYELSSFEEESWPWLQLLADLQPDLGLGKQSYEEADAWRHAAVPHFEVDLQALPHLSGGLRLYFEYCAKGLREEHAGMAAVLSKSIQAPRFDEQDRIAFLIECRTQEVRNALADEGDRYARSSALAPVSAMSRFDDAVGGTVSLSFLASLYAASRTTKGLADICRRLQDLHRRVVALPPIVLAAGLEQDGSAVAELLDLPAHTPTQAPGKEWRTEAAAPSVFANLALHAPAQVNHCYAAWPVPGMQHPDAPALAVLAELVTNLVLHQAVREEGGAYGGQASYSPQTGAFTMMSYRDPRLGATYADFERAIARVQDGELKSEEIEEAILCVVRELDRPRTPFGEFMWAWSQQQQGVTEAMRRAYRQGVLQCRAEQVRAAAAEWLHGKPYSRAAFVGDSRQDLAGLQLVDMVVKAS